MEDFPNGSENFDNEPHKKKPNVILDILIGIGISALTYALIWYFVTLSAIVGVLFILVINGFLVVKFFRMAHEAAAITILVSITPAVLLLLLFGACAISGFGILPKVTPVR